MLRNLSIGIPTTLRRKVEKYPEKMVLTMHPAPEEKGKTYRFELNKKAQEELNVGQEESTFVSPVVDLDNMKIGVTVSTERDDVPGKDKYQVTQQGAFSNRPFHKYITKILELDDSQEHEFELTKEESEDIVVWWFGPVTEETSEEQTEVEQETASEVEQ